MNDYLFFPLEGRVKLIQQTYVVGGGFYGGYWGIILTELIEREVFSIKKILKLIGVIYPDFDFSLSEE